MNGIKSAEKGGLPMNESTLKTFPMSHIKKALLYIFILYIAWTGSWLFKFWLDYHWNALTTPAGQFLYWTLMKLFLWIIPSIILIKGSGRKFRTVIGFHRLGSAIKWGGGIGLLLAAISILVRYVSHQHLFTASFSLALLNAVLVAPITEEITFRGMLMGALSQRFPFAISNIITGLMFLGAHLPGWYFQGNLLTNLLSPIGGAFSVFLLGMVFGFVAKKSQSLAGSIILHSINNLFAA